jgi:hypothetical protein
VRFDRDDYSIPHDRIHQPLTLVASETDIRVTDAVGTVLAQHRRSYDSSVVIEDPAHLEKLICGVRWPCTRSAWLPTRDDGYRPPGPIGHHVRPRSSAPVSGRRRAR